MLKLLTNFEKNYPEIAGKCKKVHNLVETFLNKNSLISENNKKNLLLAAKVYLIGMTRMSVQIREKIKRGEILNQKEKEIFKKYPKRNLDIINGVYKKEYDNEVFASALLNHRERFDGKGPNKILGYNNYQTTYILSMFDRLYDNYQINDNVDIALELIEKDNGGIDPYWIDILKKNMKNIEFREEILRILNN